MLERCARTDDSGHEGTGGSKRTSRGAASGSANSSIRCRPRPPPPRALRATARRTGVSPASRCACPPRSIHQVPRSIPSTRRLLTQRPEGKHCPARGSPQGLSGSTVGVAPGASCRTRRGSGPGPARRSRRCLAPGRTAPFPSSSPIFTSRGRSRSKTSQQLRQPRPGLHVHHRRRAEGGEVAQGHLVDGRARAPARGRSTPRTSRTSPAPLFPHPARRHLDEWDVNTGGVADRLEVLADAARHQPAAELARVKCLAVGLAAELLPHHTRSSSPRSSATHAAAESAVVAPLDHPPARAAAAGSASRTVTRCTVPRMSVMRTTSRLVSIRPSSCGSKPSIARHNP